MADVGAYEAKTHLPRLLERVAHGERITITRHGVPVAILIPASDRGSARPEDVTAEIRAFRRGRRLGRTTLKSLIREGRR